MTTTLLPLKIFLLALMSRQSECFVFGEAASVSWSTVWAAMNKPGSNVNSMSSCPWRYVKDEKTGDYKPELLPITEKQMCRQCCIDLNRSNSTRLIINPRGRCTEIPVNIPCNNRIRQIVVGYTCTHSVNLPIDKRNDRHGPLVNSVARDDAEQTRRYTTVARQHINPSLLSNAQFRHPQFLQNNNAQFRPSFLNGMGVKIGQQPLMPMFAHARRNLEYEGRRTPEELTDYFDSESSRDEAGVEETKDEREAEDVSDTTDDGNR